MKMSEKDTNISAIEDDISCSSASRWQRLKGNTNASKTTRKLTHKVNIKGYKMVSIKTSGAEKAKFYRCSELPCRQTEWNGM